MAKGAMQPTAELLAQQYNLNRGKDDKALPSARFNPYHEKFLSSAKKSGPIRDVEMARKAWEGLTDA